MTDIPQEFTREQFLARGIQISESEVRTVNQNVYELERAFQNPDEDRGFVPVDQDISDERLALLTDFARNFLR